jgi:hypothetical protein
MAMETPKRPSVLHADRTPASTLAMVLSVHLAASFGSSGYPPGCRPERKVFGRIMLAPARYVCMRPKFECLLEQFNLDYLKDTMSMTAAAAQFVISQARSAESMMATRLANAAYWSEDLCHSY